MSAAKTKILSGNKCLHDAITAPQRKRAATAGSDEWEEF
jgi:hypothetical protein